MAVADDALVRESPAWWATRLAPALWARRTGSRWSPSAFERKDVRPGLDLLRSYLAGDPPLPHVAEAWKEALYPYVRMARMNYAELVTRAPLDRMGLLGFGTAVDDDRSGDAVAARIYRENDLGLRFATVAEHMLSLGDGYMYVGREDGDKLPVITAEDPRDVYTVENPRTNRTRVAIKRRVDEWGDRVELWVNTPGRVTVFYRPGSSADGLSGGFDPKAWKVDDRQSQTFPAAYSDMVPVHRFTNRRGVGEYEPHLDVLDRINDRLFDEMVMQKYQAFRQRVGIGLPQAYPADHPKAGETIDYSGAFLADPGAFWLFPPGSSVWESTPIDFGPIRLLNKDDVEGLCAVTATPLYYTVPDAASGSAEGATTQREQLLYRVSDRRSRCRFPLTGVMADSFRLLGDDARAERSAIRPIWAPAERHSLAERMSAAAQAKAAGLPQESIYVDVMEYEPADLERLAQERGRDTIYDAAALVAVPAPAAQPRTPATPQFRQPGQPEPAPVAA